MRLIGQAERWGWIDRSPLDRVTPRECTARRSVHLAVEAVLKVIETATGSRNPDNALVLRLLDESAVAVERGGERPRCSM